ncbi:DUF4219 domain-containing protein [Tanacetum coccineum]
MECVTTTSFSISINSSLHGYFKGKRGLRQGDPLSPYLFTLVIEILTLMIRRRVRDSDLFTYHRYCSKLELVNLCFADELFLFAHGDANSASVIMSTLDEFKQVSGLTPSIQKSTAYFCNMLNHVKLSILQILPFKEGRLPVKYLGVPLVSSRLIYKDCKELIEKVQKRVNDWKNKSLSTAGRLQLIQSVIGSLHVFWASVFILPSRILLDIEQIIRDFLWCHGSMSRGKAKVVWEVVCLPKVEGSLGIRREGFDQVMKVRDLMINGHLSCPHSWLSKYPILSSIPDPVTVPSTCDVLEWRNSYGMAKKFSVKTAWHEMKDFAGLPNSSSYIDAILNDIYLFAMKKTSRSVIAKLKNRFETYVKAKDLDLWHIILNGDFLPVAKNEVTQILEFVPFEQQDDLKKKLAKNNKAKMVLYNALPKKEYERIFMCKTAKDIWQSLLITHQGNSKVKDNKIDLLVQQYEQFTIPEEESIDSGFARFNTIITSLKTLVEGFYSKNYVRKFLEALHPKWRAKVTTIEESKYLLSLALDELIDNLKVHEVVMEKDSEIYRGKKERIKSITLKANKESSDDETSTSESDDKEYAMANKILKAKRGLLEKEILELNEKIKKLERSKEIEIACKSCEELRSENARLKETQVKFVKFYKSSNSLREMLDNQKSSSCKEGLGFDSNKASTSGTKPITFVGSSAEKGTDGSTIKVHGSTLPGSVSRTDGEIST